MSAEELNEVVSLTALADELQRRVASLTRELELLRHEHVSVRSENEQLKRWARTSTAVVAPSAAPGLSAPSFAASSTQPPSTVERVSARPRVRSPAPAPEPTVSGRDVTGRAPLTRSQRRAAERAAKREERRRQP